MDQKLFHWWRSDKLHTRSGKRTYSDDKAGENHCKSKALATGCFGSASLGSFTNTGRNDFIALSYMWSNMVEHLLPSSTGRYCTNLHGDCAMETGKVAHVTVRGIGGPLGTEINIP